MLQDTVKELNQRKAAIRKEIAALNAEDKKIDRAIIAISALPVSETAPAAKPAKKKLSAAARKRIAVFQKARWAKIKGTKPTPIATPASAPSPVKKKFVMSPAHKAALKKAQAARWAKFNAAKAKPAKKK